MDAVSILACVIVLIPAGLITWFLAKKGILDSLPGSGAGCLARLMILALVFGGLCLLTMWIIAEIAG